MVKNRKKVKVSIIILTTNALSMTKEQLVDVSKLDTQGLDCECLVVDNGSSDGTEEALKNYELPNMKYKFMQSGGNLGFAGGNNVGIQDAVDRKFDYILLMNNDLILPKDIVLKLTHFMEKNKDISIVSPKMYFASGYEFHKGAYTKKEMGNVLWYAGGILDWDNIYSTHRGVDQVDRGQYDKTQPTDFANGACVIIRREVFEKIGLLDHEFFLYWEDADFSQRAKKHGMKVYYYPETCMWHKVSASTGGSGSPTNDYFITRNRYYLAMRYAKARTKFAVLRDTFKLIFVGRTWQKWGAIDALLGRKGMGQWAKR
jgi:GT2 family glycosyltransferase